MASYASIADLRAYLGDQVPENAEQRVTVTGATGGELGLSYDGETETVAYPASARTVREALAGLSALAKYAQPNGEPIVEVRGPKGGPYRVRFHPPLADDAERLVAVGADLTGDNVAVSVRPTLDQDLQDVLDRATGVIEEILGFRFDGYSTPQARTVRSYGGGVLWLPPHAPGSVSAVAWSGAALTGWGASYPEAGWPVGTLGGLTWAAGSTYTVTARWGFGPPPAGIQQICLELAVNIWRSKTSGGFAEVQGADDGSYTRFVSGLTRAQQSVLRAVRDRLTEMPV